MYERHRDSRGQTLVEFALAMMVFLPLLIGFIGLGYLVYVNNAVAQAARESSRWASVAGRSQDATYPANIVAQAKSGMAGVPTPTVTVTCFLPTNPPLGTQAAICASGDILRVVVTSVVATPLGSIPVGSTSLVAVN
jgi:Flp pilus assembly protein TadG